MKTQQLFELVAELFKAGATNDQVVAILFKIAGQETETIQEKLSRQWNEIKQERSNH